MAKIRLCSFDNEAVVIEAEYSNITGAVTAILCTNNRSRAARGEVKSGLLKIIDESFPGNSGSNKGILAGLLVVDGEFPYSFTARYPE